MFKFLPDNDTPADKDSAGGEGDKPKIEYNPCKEILIGDFHSSLTAKLKNEGRKSVVEIDVSKTLKLNSVKLSELSEMEEIFVKEDEKKVQEILKSSTDLISGVYEGGFKTWECTFDLVTYITENFENMIMKTANKIGRRLRILDMGCGSGLVGLAVLNLAEKHGVEVSVDFQDYNDEVINYITIPNTLLNFNDEMAARCRFFAGDWDSFKELMNDNVDITGVDDIKQEGCKYDLIFSSETIYNLDYFPKFLRLIKSCLRESDNFTGLYLAAKTFYFGVGGGTKSFLNMVHEDSMLEGKVVLTIKQGVQREIIHCQLQSK